MTPRPGGRGLAARLRADEQGIGIVLAVCVVAIVFAFGAGWAQMATHQVGSSAYARNREQAIQAAEAGMHAAISRLMEDPSVTSIPLTTIDQDGDAFGKYEVTIASHAVVANRYVIVSTGYGPDETAGNKGRRLLEAEVDLAPTNSFSFALMASETTWTGTNTFEADNGLNVTGDIFASGQAKWLGGSTITGSVSSWGGIDGRGTINATLLTAGDFMGCPGPTGTCSVWIQDGTASKDVFIADDTSTSDVEGRMDVTSSGVVSGTTNTLGGTYTGPGGSITGTVNAIQSVPPPKHVLPSFSWSTYTGACGCTPTVHATPALWQSHFQTYYATPGISGTHQITGSGSGTVELGGNNLIGVPITSWVINGDVVIYTDRPVKLTASVLNPGGTTRKLVIISTFAGGPKAVEFTGTVSIPDTVEVLVYAPNDTVDADASTQSLKGSIYAKRIDLANNFTIGEPTTPITVAGFSWPSSPASYSPVTIRLVKEAPS